jgi:hypothetical protein
MEQYSSEILTELARLSSLQQNATRNNSALEAQLRNMTTRELIKHCEELNDNPTVSELAKRLELCLDFAISQAGL